MSATLIREAVAAARPKLPNLPLDYADQMIAAAKTVAAVKADLVDRMVAHDGRARSRASMLKLHGKTEADLAPTMTSAQREADQLAALPKSIAEAKGDARAFGKADIQRQAAAERGVTASTSGRASMLAELKRQGIEPAR